MHGHRLSLVVLGSLVLTACPTPGPEDTEEWAAACGGVDCGAGHCVLDVDHPVCVCDEGFAPDGLHCTEQAPRDACDPNPCTTFGRTVCTAEGDTATCACTADRVEVDGTCVLRSVCVPNPCTAPFQTMCVDQAGTAVCECVPGHAPAEDGNGCSAMPAWTCAGAHSGNGEDDFEPDECPPDATELTAGADWIPHSIHPAGDVDWYRIPALPGHVFSVTAVSTSAPLYADAYAKDGITPLAADHHGQQTVTVSFRAGFEEVAFVAIRTLRQNEEANYSVRLEDLGLDDFGDDVASATELYPGASTPGELKYFGDVDVVKVPVVPGHSYSAELEWAGAEEVALELIDATGKPRQRRTTPEARIVTHATGSAVWLRIVASSPATLGLYTLTLEDLGVDDHGDARGEATPFSNAPNGTLVTFERSDDVDVLSLSVVEGHVYDVGCTVISGSSSSITLTISDELGATILQSSYGLRLGYEAETTAQRYVELKRTWNTSTATTLKCTATDLGPDDHGDDTATATPLSVGGSGTGQLEAPNDLDVFSFSATAGHIYRFTCNINGSGYCEIRLLGPGGAQIAVAHDPLLVAETPTSGTWYFEVSNYYSSAQPLSAYSYGLVDLGVDDHGDNFSSATATTIGASGAGVLETTNDVDVFSFGVTAGHVVQFVATPSSYAYLKIRLLGPGGVQRAVSSGYGSGSQSAAFEVGANGIWYAEVSMSSSGAVPAAYSWSLLDLGGDDHGDDFATATPIAAGDSGTANLEFAGDVDAFSFTPVAGRVYAFICTPGTIGSCPMALQNQLGATVFANSWQGGPIVWEAPDANPMVVLVGKTSSSSKPSGTYGWSLSDLGTDDHGDTTATATAATLPMNAQSASLESFGDVDVFSVNATAGHIYQLTCTLGTLSSCAIVAKSPAGVTVASSGYGAPASAAFAAATSGVYTFEVSDGASTASTGSYSWIVEDLGVDDHGDTLTAASPLTIDTATAGSIQYPQDVDFFSFTATAGHIYQAFCSPGSLTSCTITIQSSTGATLAQGTNAVGAEIPSGGTIYVKVVGYSQKTGTYSITVSDLGTDDHGDTWTTATALALNVPTAGQIEISNDDDYFSISLTAGSHTVTVSPSSYLDVYVFGTNGTSYLTGGSPPRTFNAATAGTYYFRVSAWGSSAGNNYSITVQ